MQKNKEQDYSFQRLMALGCGACIIIFILFSWTRGFENFFDSIYFVFIYLPLGILAFVFFFFALLGKVWIQEKYPWVCVTILVFFWVASGVHFITKKSNEIGDSFGSLNALFSGMALAAVAFTILLQRKEIEQNREELAGQKNELKEQNATQIQSRFENSFFNLLDAQSSIARNHPLEKFVLDFRHGEHFSRQFINQSILNKSRDNFENEINQLVNYRHDCIIHRLERVHSIREGIFDSYIRITYRILNFIDKFNFSRFILPNLCQNYKNDGERDLEQKIIRIKNSYIEILKSKMSISEQFVIFYSVLHPRYENFKKLIEQYYFFNTMRINTLITNQDTLLFNISAFNIIPQKTNNVSYEILDEKVFFDFLFGEKEITESIFFKDNLKELLVIWSNGILPSRKELNNSTLIPGIELHCQH